METPILHPIPLARTADLASSRVRDVAESLRFPRTNPEPPPSPPCSIPPRLEASPRPGMPPAIAKPPLPVNVPIPHESLSAPGQVPFPLRPWGFLHSHPHRQGAGSYAALATALTLRSQRFVATRF